MTANQEYEALTTVEAVRAALNRFPSVQRCGGMGGWLDVDESEPDALIEHLLANGWTFRAPAASVGDAPSDAVAVKWQYRLYVVAPRGKEWWDEWIDCDEADAEAVKGAMEKFGQYGGYKAETRALYTAPPAAPVVSDAVKWAQGLIEQLPRDHDGRNSWLLNHGIGEEPDWLRAEYARHRAAWKEWREGMPQPEMRKYAAALSVPATDDKADRFDWRELARRLYVELFHCDQQMISSRKWTQGATVRNVLADAKAALAAPTSPHDVDAVRVDEAMEALRVLVERAGDGLAYPTTNEAAATIRKALGLGG